jgi:hypothetical protein
MLLQQITEPTTLSGTFELLSRMSERFYVRLIFDFVSVFILIRFIYFPAHKKGEYFFTFFMFNLIIFLITFMLNKVEMSMGAAFGLFAVFSMLRYRTEGISLIDMTYLFTVISLGLINAVALGTWYDLLMINVLVLVFTVLFDSNFIWKKEASKKITFNNLEMIKPENREELIRQLEEQTGHKIQRIKIERVNLMTGSAIIRIYYIEK